MVGNILNPLDDSRSVQYKILQPSNSNETTETNLKHMRDIEFFCGENFLQERANNVVDAFELLTDQLNQESSNLSTNRSFSELQFIHALDRERALLQESMLRQNQRQQSEANFILSVFETLNVL